MRLWVREKGQFITHSNSHSQGVIFALILKASIPLATHRGPGDTCTHHGLCCRRGTPSFEKLNLSSWAVSRPALHSGRKHPLSFPGCKQSCPLLWRRYYLQLARLLTIQIPLKRESKTRGVGTSACNTSRNTRDPGRTISQQGRKLKPPPTKTS